MGLLLDASIVAEWELDKQNRPSDPAGLLGSRTSVAAVGSSGQTLWSAGDESAASAVAAGHGDVQVGATVDDRRQVVAPKGRVGVTQRSAGVVCRRFFGGISASTASPCNGVDLVAWTLRAAYWYASAAGQEVTAELIGGSLRRQQPLVVR
jgi:hypothetical protein